MAGNGRLWQGSGRLEWLEWLAQACRFGRKWVGGTLACLARWKGAWNGRPSGEARNVWVRAPSFWWREPVRRPGAGGPCCENGKGAISATAGPGAEWSARRAPCFLAVFSKNRRTRYCIPKPSTCPCPAVPLRKGAGADTVPDAHLSPHPQKSNKTAAKTLHHAINCNHVAASMSSARTPLCSQIPFTCEAEVRPMKETSTKTVKSGCHKGGFLLGEGPSLLCIWNWTQETPQRVLVCLVDGRAMRRKDG